MNLAALCLAFGAAGFVVGRKAVPKGRELKWLDRLLAALIFVLLFVLGAEIGSDENIVSSLGSIGLLSLALMVFAVSGSVVMVTFARKALRMDRKGRRVQ